MKKSALNLLHITAAAQREFRGHWVAVSGIMWQQTLVLFYLCYHGQQDISSLLFDVNSFCYFFVILLYLCCAVNKLYKKNLLVFVFYNYILFY